MSIIRSVQANEILAAHCHQGKSNDCGPYSAAMVINAIYPHAVEPSQLAREMDHVRWAKKIIPILRRIPQWATLPWGLVDVLRQYGLPARWRPFGRPTDLIQMLEAGAIPLTITGGWHPLWGHIMVLLAFDPDGKRWGFANPASQTNEMFWVEDGVFQQQWRAFGNIYVQVRR